MSQPSVETTRLLPGAIGEILVSAKTTGKLTLADRYGLQAAILNETLSEEELRALDRLIRSIVKGRVSVATDLSVVR